MYYRLCQVLFLKAALKKKRAMRNSSRRHHATGKALNSWGCFFLRTTTCQQPANGQKKPCRQRSQHSAALLLLCLYGLWRLQRYSAPTVDQPQHLRDLTPFKTATFVCVTGAHGVGVQKVGEVFCGQEIIQLMLASRSQPRIARCGLESGGARRCCPLTRTDGRTLS